MVVLIIFEGKSFREQRNGKSPQNDLQSLAAEIFTDLYVHINIVFALRKKCTFVVDSSSYECLMRVLKLVNSIDMVDIGFLSAQRLWCLY